MDFFGAQARSRRNTKALVLLFSLATVAVVACVTLAFHVVTGGLTELDPASQTVHLRRVIAVAFCTFAFIGLASLYRVASLRSGGGKVARDLGGTRIHADGNDRLHRRLYNVVEEMSIASGVPVPEVYVLERESGINAFAAGFSVDDAAVAVTQGALERFSRDELQGVVAHEFSHILNGDMRLNLRLMGPLFGILALALAGRMVLRGVRPVGISSRRNSGGGAAVVFAMGMALIVTGYIGVFFARLIKAGVSRQREFLADASAVQYTRQTDGIANALKTIGGYSMGSGLVHAKTEEVSHMLFATGSSLSRWFATHPPLTERIRALDAAFDPQTETTAGTVPPPADDTDSRIAAAAPVHGVGRDQGQGRGEINMEPEMAIASIGNPDVRHVRQARAIRSGLPEPLVDAAHSVYRAPMLLLALLIAPDSDEQRSRQLDLVSRRHGTETAHSVESLSSHLPAVGSGMRLSLVLMACPELRTRSAQHAEYLLTTLDELAAMDAEIGLFEFTITRVTRALLERGQEPARRDRPANSAQTIAAASALLAALAWHGHSDKEIAARALRAGLSRLGPDAPHANGADPAQVTHVHLDAALDIIGRSNDAIRPLLVDALAHTVLYDDRVAPEEAELLRAVCIILDCPMPPLVTGTARSGPPLQINEL